jgi:hypothetical protein
LMSMGTALATALGSAFVFSVLVILFSEYFKGIASFKFIVPVIFIFIAIGVFLMLLLHYASVIMEKRPGIETAALGLPEGSMRAFLALALIVLVGVFGSFIFFETRSTGVLHSVKQLSLSDEGAIQVRQNLPSGLVLVPTGPASAAVPPTRAYEILSAETNAAQIDIAKQLLTMLVTVLTTGLGFYFGSRGSEARADLDSGVKRNDALVAIQDALIKYDDAAAGIGAAVVQLKNAAIANVDPGARGPIEIELARIDEKVNELAGRAERIKAARENPALDFRAALETREDAAKLVKDATKLRADIEAAVKNPDLVSDVAKRTELLKKL